MARQNLKLTQTAKNSQNHIARGDAQPTLSFPLSILTLVDSAFSFDLLFCVLLSSLSHTQTEPWRLWPSRRWKSATTLHPSSRRCSSPSASRASKTSRTVCRAGRAGTEGSRPSYEEARQKKTVTATTLRCLRLSPRRSSIAKSSIMQCGWRVGRALRLAGEARR